LNSNKENKDIREKCPPEVYSFSPTEGPLEGGTQLTIYGDNFGLTDITEMERNERINVWVGERKCSVTQRGLTRIECTIEKVTMWEKNEENDDRSQLAQIRVEAVDSINFFLWYDVNGTATSEQKFKFNKAIFKGIHPTFGPIWRHYSSIIEFKS